jgi:hypothetical protein
MTVISATTGSKGDSAESRELAQARAYVVRKYLVGHYSLNDRQIKIVGIGKTPSGDDKVEIFVYPANSQAKAADLDAGRKSLR